MKEHGLTLLYMFQSHLHVFHGFEARVSDIYFSVFCPVYRVYMPIHSGICLVENKQKTFLSASQKLRPAHSLFQSLRKLKICLER